MNVNDLVGFVLNLVILGMFLGVGFVSLGAFSGTSGVGATASTAINQTVTAMQAIPQTWLGLIITIVVLSIIIGLVVNLGSNRR